MAKKRYYYYVAIQLLYRGKQFAFVKRIAETDNLIIKLKNKTYVSATICRGKAHADELVRRWNEDFEARGILYTPSYWERKPRPEKRVDDF